MAEWTIAALYNCRYCIKQLKNPGGLATHEPYCELNPCRQKRIKSQNAHRRKGSKAWNKGLTKSDPRVESYVNTLKQSILNGKYIPHRRSLSDTEKIARSNEMKSRYARGWESTCGRCKKYDYHSNIAGDIKVDGTWELKVCKYLDSLGVIWQRNKLRFTYSKKDGTESTYQPDFYVNDWDLFIEVKGYETDLDKCKWSQFPHKLEIWKKDKIEKLED